MLYLVGMTPDSGVTFARVQDVLGAYAHSYYRFMNWAWVICSNEPAEVWAARMLPFATRGNVLVCRFDPGDHQGWMEKAFWNWFNEHAMH
jgi:hypothetical protein